ARAKLVVCPLPGVRAAMWMRVRVRGRRCRRATPHPALSADRRSRGGRTALERRPGFCDDGPLMAPETIYGGVSLLAERLGQMGVERVLILCSPSRRFVDQVIEGLPGIETAVFDGAKVHVPAEV